MIIKELGEYSLIKRIINRNCPFRISKNEVKLEVNPGDDCAVLKIPGNNNLLLTTDTLLENTHFKLSWLNKINNKFFFRAIGYKAVAINLSDIVSMGDVKPVCCLVSLGLSEDMDLKNIDYLYEGMKGILERYDAFIAGGDIFKAEKLTVTLMMMGVLKGDKAITRNNVKDGDCIYVTGTLGDARAGLEILNKKNKNLNEIEKKLVKKFFYPSVRINEARIISSYANAMMDCSDGLYNTLKILSDYNNKGIIVDVNKLPVSEILKEWLKKDEKKIFEYAIYSGEDYELVFTSEENKLHEILPDLHLKIIGKISSKLKGIDFVYNGRKIFTTQKKAYSHFQ